MTLECVPRGDNVLVRIVHVGKMGSLNMPQNAIEGKEFVVEAIGPKVDDLKAGDKVLMIGHAGVNYFPLPNNNNLIVIKQEFVILVFKESEE